ncbi:L,D-transpeptidase family protein [Natronosporangium hydrolyticum]|uniref:L,D-transpeptidase family protein n=1 Tax=Natronosporangium hydrolyticum TaxID=2811111 RepID=A0A895Y9N6_9ACTN|nr:Ig-like domain-containing protein [Natronosporangium hydrolyticum]QSB13025.1 L,D-transpeptidase family protein [Natronosporangium hydrolyticum]
MARVVGGWRGWVALAVVVPLNLVACGRSAAPPTPDGDLLNADGSPVLRITPPTGADDAPLSTEIGTEVTGGVLSEVALVDEDGDRVAGRMRADGTGWVPNQPLAPETTYRATVTAANRDGQRSTVETSFTTMTEPERRTDTGLYLQDGAEYGVAMPVVVEFHQPVPPEARAEVQRRMFVSTDPPQPGAWSWVADGRQAFYRAPEHWQPGTTISARIALDGHPTGDDRYGDADRSATATIGRALSIEVDNATKQMTVEGDGVEARSMPVSLGKPSTPSSSGNLVVMSRKASTIFDTFAELGDAGYRVEVAYAMRLSWQGEFIHAAPWSVGDQGVRNVSHGCVNLATADAQWLYEVIKVGDPVTVTGTERQIEHGNGWTAWELSWDEFIEGSALPVADDPTELALATALPAN